MKIVIFGAGRSSVYLISEMQRYCEEKACFLTVIDQSFEALPTHLWYHVQTQFLCYNIQQKNVINTQVKNHDFVISMLPPALHIEIAEACLVYKKHLITASYVSKKMRALHAQAQQKGVLLLNEVGVDPGLDHISALCLLDKIKEEGGLIKSFKSHTGGIVAQKNLSNLWDYKITWNPKNVVGAGREGAVYLKESQQVHLAYAEVFAATENLEIRGEKFDSYANRNSLTYLKKYQLYDVETCYRGTLRHHGFCEAWHVLVVLGLTEDTQFVSLKKGSTRSDFLALFLPIKKDQSLKQAFIEKLDTNNAPSIVEKFAQLGFFENAPVLKVYEGTAAQILQDILVNEWKSELTDQDMLLMHHEVAYEKHGKTHQATSTLKVVGKDSYYTAMAITVGATLFEAFRLVTSPNFLNQKENYGVQIPTTPNFYKALYDEVKKHDLVFEEVFVK